MKTTSLSFLALATTFALQACAAPTTESTDAPANIDPASVANDEVEAPATKLAGAFGAPAEATMQAGTNAALVNQEKAGSTAKTQLFVPSTNTTYDVYSYDFGIVAGEASFVGGTRDVPRPTLMPLTVSMKANAFAQEAFSGKAIGEIVLRRPDANGKMVDVAVFKQATVMAAGASAAGSDGVTDSYAIAMQSMKINSGAASVSFNAVTNEASMTNISCTGDLPGFVQSTQSADVIAKGSVRVDSVAVAVSGSPVSLDGISVNGSLANMGLCAFYDAASGKGPKAARVAVAAASLYGWKPMPREATTWEACMAQVSAVTFSGSYDGAPNEAVMLDAAGLVRTDRTFDNFTGAETSSTSYGFSFVGNFEIKSCSDPIF